MHAARIVVLLLCLVFQYLSGDAQTGDYLYQPLRAEGPIPEDFLLSYEEKYAAALQKCVVEQGENCTEATQDFYQRDIFFLHEVLLSGMVLFNDPVSRYLNEVADRLLESQEELRNQLRFYVVKSPTPNAYSSQEGIILVNAGLLAYLENEAQLAFILSHEIAHYQLSHPLMLSLNAHSTSTDEYTGTTPPTMDEMLRKRLNYSRELELDADLEGMKLYLKSSYDPQEVLSCLDLLHRLEHENTFAPYLLAHELQENLPVTISPDYLDIPHDLDAPLSTHTPQTNSYHPDPAFRKAELQKYLSKVDPPNQSSRTVDQTTFLKIQQTCRFECCRIYLLRRQYAQALNHIYPLLKIHPQNKQLKKFLGHGWYGLAKYSLAGKLWDVHTTFEEIRGNSKEIFYFIEQLQPEELLELAMWYNWHLQQDYPGDFTIDHMVKDLLLEWLLLHRDQRLSQSHTEAPLRYSFTSITPVDFQESSFFHRWVEQVQSLLPRADSLLAIQEMAAQIVTSDEEQLRLAEHGFNLGLQQVVFVDPTIQINGGEIDAGIQYDETVRSRKELFQMVQEHASSIGLSYTFLSMHTLTSNAVGQFNDVVYLNEWYAEKNLHGDLEMISLLQDSLTYMEQKYHTPHFAWMGIISFSRPRTSRRLMLFAGALLPVLLPYTLYYRQSDNHGTFLYAAVCDFTSGKYLVRYPKLLRMKARRDMLNSLIFDLIYQIHQAS